MWNSFAHGQKGWRGREREREKFIDNQIDDWRSVSTTPLQGDTAAGHSWRKSWERAQRLTMSHHLRPETASQYLFFCALLTFTDAWWCGDSPGMGVLFLINSLARSIYLSLSARAATRKTSALLTNLNHFSLKGGERRRRRGGRLIWMKYGKSPPLVQSHWIQQLVCST